PVAEESATVIGPTARRLECTVDIVGIIAKGSLPGSVKQATHKPPAPASLARWHGRLRLRPVQMAMQEAERADAVNLVRAVEELDLGPITDAQLIVPQSHLGVLVGHLGIGRHAV